MSVGEIFWMQLDVSQTNNFLYLNAQAADALLHMLLQLKQHCIRTDLNKITNAAKTLQYAILNTSLRNPFQIANYIVTFLYLLLSYTSLTSLQVSLDIVRACEYIDRHITADAGGDCRRLLHLAAAVQGQVQGPGRRQPPQLHQSGKNKADQRDPDKAFQPDGGRRRFRLLQQRIFLGRIQKIHRADADRIYGLAF